MGKPYEDSHINITNLESYNLDINSFGHKNNILVDAKKMVKGVKNLVGKNYLGGGVLVLNMSTVLRLVNLPT